MRTRTPESRRWNHFAGNDLLRHAALDLALRSKQPRLRFKPHDFWFMWTSLVLLVVRRAFAHKSWSHGLVRVRFLLFLKKGSTKLDGCELSIRSAVLYFSLL
jgi:hypothetical protein